MSLPSSPSTLQIHLSRIHTCKCTQHHRLITKKQVPHTKSLRKWTPESVRGRMAILAALEKHFQSRAAHIRMQMTVHCVNFISTMKENSKNFFSQHSLTHTLISRYFSQLLCYNIYSLSSFTL